MCGEDNRGADFSDLKNQAGTSVTLGAQEGSLGCERARGLVGSLGRSPQPTPASPDPVCLEE